MTRLRIQDTDDPKTKRYVVVPDELPPLESKERTQWSAANKPALQKPAETKRRDKIKPPTRTGTRASDQAVGLQRAYPNLGDYVMVNVERVLSGDRKHRHQFLTDHGVHGKYGRVVGSKIEGGDYFLEIEHATGRVFVAAECVDPADQAPQQAQQQHEPRLSPERMRKSRRGAYNMT